jgi:hypothetical protein
MISQTAFEGHATKFIPILAQNVLESFGQPCDKNTLKTNKMRGSVKSEAVNGNGDEGEEQKERENPCS